MTPADIYQDFEALVAAEAMSGDTPQGLADLLTSLGVTTLPITNGVAGQSGDGAWMTGGTTWRQTSWTFRMTGRPGGDPSRPDYVALSLSMTAVAQSTPWTFAQAFPDTQLPKSRVAKSALTPPAAGGGMILGPSVIAPLVLETPALTAANHPQGDAPLPVLSGWLNLTGGQLARYVAYLGSARLWISGTVDLTDPSQPILLMNAPAPGASTNFGEHIALSEMGLRLWSAYPDPSPLPDEGAPTSSAQLYGIFTAATLPPTVADMSTPLLFGDYVWPLYIAFGDAPLSLSTGAQMLSSLITGSDPAQYTLPPGVAALNLFGVSELEFGLIPSGRSLTPGVGYSAVTVVSLEPWDPPVPFILIDQVGVRWMFDWTGDTLMTATIWGTMTFGAKGASAAGPGSTGAMAPVSRRSETWRTDGALFTTDAETLEDAKVTLTLRFDIPDMAFSAYTENPIALPIADAFAAYFATPPLDSAPLSLIVSEINFQASLPRKTYEGGLTVLGNWPIQAGAVIFNLTEMEFQVRVSQNSVAGAILGTVDIAIPDEAPVQMLLQAQYPGDGHWIFSGELIGGPINLPKFVTAFLGYPYPAWMQSDTFVLNLTNFFVSYSTAPGNPYEVNAGVAAALKDTVLGIPVAMTAAVAITRFNTGTNDTPVMVTAGALSGSFTVSRIKITAALSFRENEKTYTFSVAYRDLTLSGATAWVGQGEARRQTLTLRLSGETLGGVVRYLVSLANPNANFRLEPPWDFLDTIELGRFALIIDPTLEQVTLTYDVNLNLAFARLDTVGIRYDRSTGTPQVDFVLTGQVLGTPYTPDKPLTWDAVNEAPPAIPGKGQSLFDLRYLGLGQHVTLKGMTDYDSIADVIDAMRAQMQPFDDPRKDPIDPATMSFDPASQWLFGIDCTIMDTVTLKLVLHDPDLYGVLLSLAGPDAGSLAGLSFELMYKKVTADVGVFHVRLQVPDAFRQLQFGAVSVTLGVVTVDIYTNGNFLVDLGFPHNRDFSVSFGVEAGIFNGRGGIYFGLRDGATSDRTPRITNGTFSPVIELGVGLEVGVGRTFEKGPLSAGLYVDVVVVFEGVLAWFHPSDAGESTALYYWCRGTAGIVGKLYGSIDFKIISVSVSLEAHALATLTLAAYEATLIELDVGVSVHASVHFLFFSVSFSFSLQLETSFTIGESSPTPWRLDSNQSGRGQSVRMTHAWAPSRRRPPTVRAITRDTYRLRRFAHPAVAAFEGGEAAIRAVAPTAAMTASMSRRRNGLVAGVPQVQDSGYHLTFDKDAAVFPDGQFRLGAIKLTPAFTVADVPVDWTGETPPPTNPDPAYRIALMLIADCAVPPGLDSIAASRRADIGLNALAGDPASTTFGQLMEGLLRWSLYALGVTSPTATVTSGALEELVEQLALPEAASQGFTWDNLDGFFNSNLHLTMSVAPLSDATAVGGVVFPMIPPLYWSATGLPPEQAERQFWSYQPVDANYEAEALLYFAPLDARAPGAQPDPQGRIRAARAAGETTESMATFVFRDYCLMIARTTVQAAINLLSAFPHTVQATDSLAHIASLFPTTPVAYVKRPGDTVESVAVVLGLSSLELLTLNPGFADTLSAAAPGETLQVNIGVTAESIAAANPAWPVVGGLRITLGDLAVQVQPTDTLATIATRYAVALPSWLASAPLLAQPGLLRAVSAIALPAFTYANPLNLPVETVAAAYWVRLGGYQVEADVPKVDWYAETIVALNPPEAIPVTGPLAATLLVPASYDPDGASPLPPLTWTTLPGDTLASVAGTIASLQVGGVHPAWAAWLAAVVAANTPAPVSGVALPATSTLLIRPDDTLAAVRQRLLLDPTDPAQQATFQALASTADILTPLASVIAPSASGATVAGQTLLDVAQAYDLALEDLGRRLADDAGVLALPPENDPRTLVIPAVPAMGLTDLTAALHDPAVEASVAGQVSRFMLYGLRLPAPELVDGVYRATGPVTGLYDLVGQQVTGPAPTVPDPALVLTMDKGETCDWLTFSDLIVTADGDTLAALTTRHDDLLVRNPGLSRWADTAGNPGGVLPSGMMVLTDPGGITLTLTAADLLANYPATVLLPAIEGEIAPLTLYREMDIRHPVTQVVLWRTSVAPTLPTTPPEGASPTFWLLPGDLMGQAAAGISTSAFRLKQISPQVGPSAVPVELGSWAWGTLIDIDVRSVPGSPDIVEILGADTADRQRLADLLAYLGVLPGGPTAPAGEGAELVLTWQLPASSGTPSALTSTPLIPAETFVVKVNLSTETHSGVRTRAERGLEVEPTAGPYFASVADSADFLTLLWEASVVGGGGYWLHAGGGDAPIPQTIFDQDGRATLSLLIQLTSQSTTTGAATNWPVRNLLSFNNCAVVGDGVDPGSQAVFAEASNPAQTARAATVPQGQVGFTLDLTNPGTTAPTTAQMALQQLYSLIGYQLVETAAFLASDEGQPLGPDVGSDPDGEPDENTWKLMRVVPINRFARSTPLLDLPAYPSPAASPYAGIQGASSPDQYVAASTRVQLWFHDVLGNASAGSRNRSVADDGLTAAVDIPVTYTDPLLGVAGWPSATPSYQVVADPNVEGQALLVVSTALQAAAYLPGASQGGADVLDKAARDHARYAGIYYQVMQPDVTAALLTTLRQTAGQDPEVLATPIAPLQSFAIGVHVFLGGLATRTACLVQEATSLDLACTRYGVSYDALGAANAATPLDQILAGSTFAMPRTVMFRAGDTVEALCDAAVPPANAVSALSDPDNAVLPLMAGVEIDIPATTVAVPDPSPDTLTLLKLAKCSLNRLVLANKDTAGLLTPGFIFVCNGVSVMVDETGPGADATLTGVASVFQGEGLPFDAAMIVSLNADRPGLFRAGVNLAINSYIAKAGDTLAVNGAGVDAAALAPLNTGTVTLFPDGSPLFVQTVATPIPPATALGDIAADAAVEPGDILRHNGAATLATTPNIIVPGLSGWPAAPAAPTSLYSLRAADTLRAAAARFAIVGAADTITPLDLAQLNPAMPDIFVGDQPVTVGSQTIRTVTGDSFQSVCDRFNPPITLDALIPAIEDVAGLMAAGGLLVCPPGRLGAAAQGQTAVTPLAAATPYGLSPSALLGANAGTPGLIMAGVPLTGSTTNPLTLTTAAADSVTAILERFRLAGVTTSIEDLALANAEVLFLTPLAAVLVPPIDAVLQAALATSANDGGWTWQWPGTIFPIHAWVQLRRATALVDPDLAGTPQDPSSVVQARSAVPVARHGLAIDDPDGGAVTLVGFARNLQTAIPALRVATGKVLSDQQDDQTGTDVWAVDFAADGVASVTVTPPVASVAGATGPQPRSFALRPLSTVLVARQDIEIATLDPTTGLLTGTRTANYQGIDLEVWARAMLSDVDHLLSAECVAGGYAVRSSALQTLIGAKQTLAAAMADGLAYVLEGEGSGAAPADDPDLASAVETLRQTMLTSLTQGYKTAAVIQYDTATASAFGTPTARLSGVPVATLSDLDPALKAATLSNGKISLMNGASRVDVLVQIPDVEVHSALEMRLDYSVVELEFNISDQVDGYQKSDWLTFVTTLGSGSPAALAFDLGSPMVPLPLRAYPQMPTLLDHQALGPTEPATLAEAVLWSYACTVRHQTAEQDQIELEVVFNEPPQMRDQLAVTSDDLFGQLAQYTANAAGLLDILADLPRWRALADTTRLGNALASYASCIEGIAAAWLLHWNTLAAAPAALADQETTGPVVEVYGFTASLAVDGATQTYKTLTLLRTAKPVDGAVGWPDIVCITLDGVPHPLRPVDKALCQLAVDDDAQCYAFPDGDMAVPAFSLLDFRFSFGGLAIASYQNGTAKVSVVRNARLLGPDGAATRSAFIYRTPVMSYQQPAEPFIDITDRLSINAWSYVPADCPLNAAFEIIFDGDETDRSIACGIRYGYELAPGAPPDIPPLETYLPVRQTPAFTFSSTTVADICTTLQAWVDANDPAVNGGRWSFWIDMRSAVDPQLQRSILRLRHIVSNLDQD